VRAAKATKPTADSAIGLRATCSAGGLNDREAKPLHDTTQVIRAELIGTETCKAAGITANGNAPALALCRRLVATGHDPGTPLEAWRGDVLALRVRSIGEAARLRVVTHSVGFERDPECTGGPYIRKNDPACIPATPTYEAAR
jgi:hypothetical protein